MKPSIETKLEQLSRRMLELESLLSAEDVTRDMEQYRKLTKERADIQPIVERFHQYQTAVSDIATAEQMLGDVDMRDYAEEEMRLGKERMLDIERDLQTLLLPRDPNDERNVFLEIRAGTGGDESALFAGDLFRMYARYAERNRWQVEIISESVGEVGGYNRNRSCINSITGGN